MRRLQAGVRARNKIWTAAGKSKRTRVHTKHKQKERALKSGGGKPGPILEICGNPGKRSKKLTCSTRTLKEEQGKEKDGPP